MTESQLQMSYLIAQMYYQKKLTVKEVKALAVKEGISENSQSNYFCPAYRHLVNGTSFNGKLSVCIWEYYLSQIFTEFNTDIKRNALKCFLHAIEYSEAKSNSNAFSLREIYSRYHSKLTTSGHNQGQD